jgi:hypothetical protein
MVESVDVTKLKSGKLDINEVRKKHPPDFLNIFQILVERNEIRKQ